MTNNGRTHDPVEGVDVGEVLAAIRREWRQVALALAVAMAAAAAVLLFAPRRFEGAGSVLVRSGASDGSLLAKVSLAGQLAGSGGGGLAGSLGAATETELELLRTRTAMEAVMDSLALQAEVLSPRGLPATSLLAAVDAPGAFRKRTYRFERDRSAAVPTWRMSGPDDEQGTVTAGGTVRLAVGTLRLRADTLPDRFTLRLLDREDAAKRMGERLSVAQRGNASIARVTFRAADSLTAARVPNLLIAEYMRRHASVDRGLNDRRLTYLEQQTDSLARELVAAERRLREFQERTGAFDPAEQGKLRFESLVQLRQQLGAVEVEERALAAALAAVRKGERSPRELAVFPSFLRSQAVGEILTQIARFDAERTRLLERRTERDPEVVAIAQSTQQLEAQLAPLAESYAQALRRQREELTTQVEAAVAPLRAIPGEAEATARARREVHQLGQAFFAAKAQLQAVQLAAIDEGGHVRQLDVARPSKRPVFPRPLPVLGMAVVGGLLLGLLLALRAAYLGRWVRSAADARRLAGAPAVHFDPARPLFVSALDGLRTVLVVPVGRDADGAAVARAIANVASRRRDDVRVLEVAPHGHAAGTVRRTVEEAEAGSGTLVVTVPSFEHDGTVTLLDERRPVVLVARAGRVERRQLADAVDTLQQLGAPVAGVVVQQRNGNGAHRDN